MKEKKSNIGKYLLILVPFVMGVTGFTVLDGQPVVDSAVSEYGDVFPELFGFTAEYTDRDRQMDSTAYDGQRSSDVDIKDPWKDIAVAAVLPRRQHCRIWG